MPSKAVSYAIFLKKYFLWLRKCLTKQIFPPFPSNSGICVQEIELYQNLVLRGSYINCHGNHTPIHIIRNHVSSNANHNTKFSILRINAYDECWMMKERRPFEWFLAFSHALWIPVPSRTIKEMCMWNDIKDNIILSRHIGIEVWIPIRV